MSSAQTRVYRNGVLESEGFPVADVSEYLAELGHGGVGRLLRPIERTAPRTRRRARPARAGRRGRARASTSDRSSTTTTTHLFLSAATRCASTPRRRVGRDRDRRVHQQPLAHHRPQERGVRDGAGAASGGTGPRISPSTASASCCTACSTWSSTATSTRCRPSTTTTTRSARASSPNSRSTPPEQRHWFEMRRALVRFHRLVVPMREAVSGLMRREHAAVSEELVPVLPGRLRPHPAGQRVDRRAARPRQHHRRDEPEPARLPAEPDR